MTLYEAIVSLAIAGIIAAIGIPSLRSILANTRLASATNTVLVTLYATRSEAIKRGQRTTLCASSDLRTCTGSSNWDAGSVLYVDVDDNGDLDPGEPVLQVFGGLPDVTIRTSTGRNRVTYQPDGRATGTNLSFRVCVRGASAGRAVIVSNSGRPRVATRMPNGTNPCPG